MILRRNKAIDKVLGIQGYVQPKNNRPTTQVPNIEDDWGNNYSSPAKEGNKFGCVQSPEEEKREFEVDEEDIIVSEEGTPDYDIVKKEEIEGIQIATSDQVNNPAIVTPENSEKENSNRESEENSEKDENWLDHEEDESEENQGKIAIKREGKQDNEIRKEENNCNEKVNIEKTIENKKELGQDNEEDENKEEINKKKIGFSQPKKRVMEKYKEDEKANEEE